MSEDPILDKMLTDWFTDLYSKGLVTHFSLTKDEYLNLVAYLAAPASSEHPMALLREYQKKPDGE